MSEPSFAERLDEAAAQDDQGVAFGAVLGDLFTFAAAARDAAEAAE